MNKEIEKYESIERYLSGRMPETEMEETGRQILADKDFAAEIMDHEQIFKFIEKTAGIGIRDQIKTIHNKNTKRLQVRKKRIRNIILATTGAIVIAIIVYFMLSQQRNQEAGKEVTPVPVIIKEENHEEMTLAVNDEKEQKTGPKAGIPRNDAGIHTASEMLQEEKSLTEVEAVQLKSDELQGEQKLLFREKTDDTPEINYKVYIPVADPDIPIPFDCSKILIDAVVITGNSCNNAPTGELSIEENSISGGTGPYQLSIDNSVTYQNSLHLSSLAPVSYSVWLRDRNECKTWLGDFKIGTFDCTYEEVFAPYKGEQWKIPNREQACRIVIFNQAGSVIYENSFGYPGTYYWDGRDANGNMVFMGAYTFIIRPESGMPVTGTITIVR